MTLFKCNKCGKKTTGFYCISCKQKEVRRIEIQEKANHRRRLESEMKKFESYLKSGKRTY